MSVFFFLKRERKTRKAGCYCQIGSHMHHSNMLLNGCVAHVWTRMFEIQDLFEIALLSHWFALLFKSQWDEESS